MKAATLSTVVYLAEDGLPNTVQWGLITDLQSRAGSDRDDALALFADWNAAESAYNSEHRKSGTRLSAQVGNFYRSTYAIGHVPAIMTVIAS